MKSSDYGWNKWCRWKRGNLLRYQKNLKNYSLKELICLYDVLIDVTYYLTEDKESLNNNLGEYETKKIAILI